MEAIEEELLQLLNDYHAYNPGFVPVIDYPTPLEFSKQVSKGLPCVYSIFEPGLTSHCNVSKYGGQKGDGNADRVHTRDRWWPAFSWKRAELINHVKSPVEVAITPDGRADSLCSYGSDREKVFLQPATMMMTISELLGKLCGPPSPKGQRLVYYLQSQNSNLTNPPNLDENPLAALMDDLPTNFDFAEQVLAQPDAVNIWIGSNESVTSTHRDPYENLYLVLKGKKKFTLWAPVDEVVMDAQMVRTGQYVYDSRIDPSFKVVLDAPSRENEPEASKIPWIPIDPLLPRSKLNSLHPLYYHAQPLHVTVSEGQMLYLPAGWFHHVVQECGVWQAGSSPNQNDIAPCIAVNYWYDQDYEGEKYVMKQHVSRLVERLVKTNNNRENEHTTDSVDHWDNHNGGLSPEN